MLSDLLRPRSGATCLLSVACLLAPVGGAAWAQETEDGQEPQIVTVVAGERYDAGGLHKLFFGNAYRDMWTTPIRAELLDLEREAGGLTPLFRVGRLQTPGLAFRGADGRAYTFRGVDKDPTRILPEILQDTPIADIAQDQVSSSMPASGVAAIPIAQAAGVLQLQPRLVVMPDDPRLGEFREDFAGLLGTFFEFPSAGEDGAPGTFGAVEFVNGEDIYDLLNAGPDTLVDDEAFLRARIVDLLLGDWDRHKNQWRWARIPGEQDWQPTAEDRDQAFSRYEGIAMGMARDKEPKFDSWRAKYQGLEGLAWNARTVDRRLLSGLDWATWERHARDIQGRLTDAVLEESLRRMPPEYYALQGERMLGVLKARRDDLLEEARRFYRFLSRRTNVFLTNSSELVAIQRHGDGSVTIRASRAGTDAGCQTVAQGGAFFERTFQPDETKQVRLYTGAGNDRVIVTGSANGRIDTFVIGGDGNHLLCANGAEIAFDFSTHGDPGKGRKISAGLRIPPADTIEANGTPEAEQGAAVNAKRDWGSTNYRLPWIGLGPDIGLFVGLGVVFENFDFRKRPYSTQQQVRVGFSFGALRPRIDYYADRRSENSNRHYIVRALVSGIETFNYFGPGNDSVNTDDRDFHRVKESTGGVEVRVAWDLGDFRVSTGPRGTYTIHDLDDPRLIAIERPYGTDDIGQVGWTAGINWNTREYPPGVRDAKASDDVLRWGPAPIGTGYTVDIDGVYYADTWNLRDDYTVLRGTATAAYWLSRSGPGVAIRVGGQHNIGEYPYYDAAYIGAKQVRGLPANRFAGDSSLYGNTMALFKLGRVSLVIPGYWGVFARGDVGRVWVEGEDSNTWHWGYGGGLFFAPWNLSQAVRILVANSDDGVAGYFLLGFGF